MGPTEFKLLHFFMTQLERVYSREQLLNQVWGTTFMWKTALLTCISVGFVRR